MPPKVKVTKEEIIAAALEILRQKGMEAVNARAVAAALGCSTQPIFSNYSSMGALQHDVLAAGYAEYNRWIEQQMKEGRPTRPPAWPTSALPAGSPSSSRSFLCGTGPASLSPRRMS